MGDAKLLQHAFPPDLALITAGGYTNAEYSLMLKRSPGPKVRGTPSSTIGLPERSFLVDIVTECSYPSRRNDRRDSSGILRLGLKPPGSSCHSGSTITSECSSGLDVVFIHWFCLVMSCWLGTVSLTINLIVLQLTNPRKY